MFYIYVYIKFVYLKDRVTEKERIRERGWGRGLPSVGSLPGRLYQAGLGEAKTRTLWLYWSLPYGCQGCKHLNHLSLLSQAQWHEVGMEGGG